MMPGMMKLPPRDAVAPMEEALEIESEETPLHEDMEAAAVQITPEAVCYRGANEVCGNCKYMEASGECQALKMQVEPGAGCNLFAEGGQGA